MIPLFQSPGDESPNRRRATRVLFVSFLAAMLVGLLMILMRGAVPSMALMIVAAVVLVAGLVGLIALAYGLSTQRAEKDKRKRGFDGQDMYTLIDRLVDDLDDDERAYLQKRLDEHHSIKNDELAESVERLLERRSQNRQP